MDGGTRSSPFRAGGLAGPGPLGGRLRSASPSRRALAIDMRRIASLLRDPAGALQGCGESMNNSICSSPNSAWEPGDRGAAPVTGLGGAGGAPCRATSLSRTVMQNQFTALAERINAGVTMLQRQCETDRRRLGQLEKKFEAKVADVDKPDGRERWAEVQGSVSGLLEETQTLARRLDGLDERLWARTSGSEASKQRNRELEQQVQALEQQNRLAAAAAEELQKRQATKLRRAEHSLEEVLRRVATLEDEVRQRSAPHRDGYFEAKFMAMEQNQEALEADLRALQANLEDGLQQIRDEFTNGGQEGGEHGNDVFEAVRKADVGLSALERKVTGQVEDVSSTVASLRVKVDGVLHRVSGLAERMETAHEPSINSLRTELSQARGQERREVDAEVQALKHRLQQVQDSNDEACSEIREALRQARAETAALSCRPDIQEDNTWMRSTEERLGGYEQDLFDLRERLEELTQGDLDGKAVAIKPSEDLEDLRRRLDWLEEHGTSAEKPELGRLAQVQNTICDLVEQVSKLKQQASSAEANNSSWQQQVKQIHGLIERKQNEDAASLRVTSEVEAKVGALSSQVADLAARLLEVEGNLDFVRENEPSLEAPVPRALSAASPEGPNQPSALQEKLEAVAAHLEVVDDLTDRLGDLERRWNAGQEQHGVPGNQSPGPLSEVSFGGEAPMKAASHQEMGRELGDLQLRLDANDGKLKSLQEEVRTKLALAKAEGQGAQTQLNDFAARLGSFEQILSTLQEAPAASFADLDALRLEFADKFDKAPGDETGDLQAETSRLVLEMKEVKNEVQELSDKVDLTLDDLKDGLVATKHTVEAAMTPIKEELNVLRSRLPDAEAEASAEQVILEKLEEVDEKIKGFQKELQASASGPKATDLKEMQDAIKRLQEAPPSPASEVPSNEMKKVEEEMQKALKESIAGLETKLAAVACKDDAEKDQKELRETLDDLRKTSEAEVLECKEQLKLLEQKIAEGSPGECAEDLKVRSQVQQQVQDLGLQLSKEVANLAEHQRDIMETRTSLEDLTKQFDENVQKEMKQLRSELGGLVDRCSSTETVATTAKQELQGLQKELGQLVDRVSSTESKSSEMKKDLEELLGPRNKIGISTAGPESPLDEVRSRLDLLCEQVTELQSKQNDREERGPNVAVINTPHVGRQDTGSADGSLNFSLTEQTERPGAADGSLNFSLTETAKELPTTLTERRAPNLYINAEADSDADADILSASDSPASAAGKIATAGLADLKDDDEVPSVHSGASAASEPDSPSSEKKDASSSQVSASFNEMSVMADYSVELSTELDEKCDFVEAVRPVPRDRAGGPGDRGSRDRGAMAVSSPIQEAEEEEVKETEAKAEAKVPGPSDALDSLLKPQGPRGQLAPLAPLGGAAAGGGAGDALDGLLGPKATLLPRKLEALDGAKVEKETKKEEVQETQPKVEPKVEKEEEKDDDDYDDNSFDDNMSVPESIQVESDLGSDTRRTEDSV